MKYNAKEMKNGKWAVFTGKRYFTDTICDTENDAVIKACEISAQYHQMQMDECKAAWEKAHRANGRVDNYDDSRTIKTSMDFSGEWGNVLC